MPYAVEDWFDVPDAERIKRDGALAASRLDSSGVFFPYAAAQARGARAALEAEKQRAAEAAKPKPKSLRQQAMEEIKAVQQRAFDATQARIDEAKTGYQSRRDRSLAALAKRSKGDEADVKRKWDAIIAERKAAAVRSGMVNTPAWTSEYKGLLNSMNRELRDVTDARLNTEINLDLSTSKDQLDFLGSIDDTAPDTSAYLRLAELEGSGTTQGLDPNAFGNPFAGAPLMMGGAYGLGGQPGGGYGGPMPTAGYGPQATAAKAAAPTLGQLRNMDPAAYQAKFGRMQTHGPNAAPPPVAPNNPFRGMGPASAPMVPLPPPQAPLQVDMLRFPQGLPAPSPTFTVPKPKPLTYAPAPAAPPPTSPSQHPAFKGAGATAGSPAKQAAFQWDPLSEWLLY